MEITKHTRKDDIQATQNDLEQFFSASDTWGTIETKLSPEHAEREFLVAMCSGSTAAKQDSYRNYAKKNNISLSVNSKHESSTEYTVVPKKNGGCKILFVTDYAQPVLKAIFTKANMGVGMKIHTVKIRNRFEATSWSKESWYFVAYALVSGSEYAFSTISKY